MSPRALLHSLAPDSADQRKYTRMTYQSIHIKWHINPVHTGIIELTNVHTYYVCIIIICDTKVEYTYHN